MSAELADNLSGIESGLTEVVSNLPVELCSESLGQLDQSNDGLAEVGQEAGGVRNISARLEAARACLSRGVESLELASDSLVSYMRRIGIGAVADADRVVIPQSERLTDETLLFKERVRTLEQEAAAGVRTGGKPTHFLIGTEVESSLVDDEGLADAVNDARDANDPVAYAPFIKHGFVNPGQYIQLLSSAERQAAVQRFREEASDYVMALPEEDENAAERKQRWLEAIPHLGIRDLINFRLYSEFSNPTTGSAAPQPNATYEAMTEYGEERGWVEFRFGDGELQAGWYDCPGVFMDYS